MTVLQSAPRNALLGEAAIAWRTVLVHAEPGEQAAGRLDAAAALAQDLDALLVGVGAETVEPYLYSDPYLATSANLYGLLRDQLDQNLKAAEKAFRDRAGGLRLNWRSVADRPVPVMSALARSADVIVAGGAVDGADDPYRKAGAAELALASGRPVLVVPSAAHRLKAEKIVVAWKESRESRRALSDALPLLKSAKDVLVLAVTDAGAVEEAEAEVADVAKGLERHGVAVRAKTQVAHEDKVAEVLDGTAAEIGADLIVAGCYGRSRMNEWLFGGVTRDLLRLSHRFVLFSH